MQPPGSGEYSKITCVSRIRMQRNSPNVVPSVRAGGAAATKPHVRLCQHQERPKMRFIFCL
jgi:hypothetical protein